LDPEELEPEELEPPVAVAVASVTGHTVVEMATTSVVVCPTLAGQSVTVAAQEVIT
jgi:hypothetical protein